MSVSSPQIDLVHQPQGIHVRHTGIPEHQHPGRRRIEVECLPAADDVDGICAASRRGSTTAGTLGGAFGCRGSTGGQQEGCGTRKSDDSSHDFPFNAVHSVVCPHVVAGCPAHPATTIYRRPRISSPRSPGTAGWLPQRTGLLADRSARRATPPPGCWSPP